MSMKYFFQEIYVAQLCKFSGCVGTLFLLLGNYSGNMCIVLEID